MEQTNRIEKAKIEVEQLKRNIKISGKKQLITCKDPIKYQRAMLRFNLECAEKEKEIINVLRDIKVKLAQIGYDGISAYFLEVGRNMREIEKEIQEERKATSVKE
jgi:hypothetical protein